MDRKNLVEELQKAFQGDDRAQSAENEKGTEFVQNTNTLRVNEYTLPVEEEENKVQIMTEEELFSRLLKERRGK
ncbi:MAG: hypothetical protein J1D89_01695 [Agathobacter sp.]|nr:hypothetical protein [Agathobacter sp.]